MVACVRIHAQTKHLMLHLVERPPNVYCTTRSKIERKKTSNEEKKKEQMNRKEVEKKVECIQQQIVLIAHSFTHACKCARTHHPIQFDQPNKWTNECSLYFFDNHSIHTHMQTTLNLKRRNTRLRIGKKTAANNNNNNTTHIRNTKPN